MFYILPLLILWLAAEIYTFILFGTYLGAISTILLTFITAFIGVWIVKLQGLATAIAAIGKLRTRQTPLREAYDGFVLLFAGLLLLLPGFVSDFFGALLLIPSFRGWLLEFMADEALGIFTFGLVSTESLRRETKRRSNDEDVIDAEFEVEEAPTSAPHSDNKS